MIRRTKYNRVRKIVKDDYLLKIKLVKEGILLMTMNKTENKDHYLEKNDKGINIAIDIIKKMLLELKI